MSDVGHAQTAAEAEAEATSIFVGAGDEMRFSSGDEGNRPLPSTHLCSFTPPPSSSSAFL